MFNTDWEVEHKLHDSDVKRCCKSVYGKVSMAGRLGNFVNFSVISLRYLVGSSLKKSIWSPFPTKRCTPNISL